MHSLSNSLLWLAIFAESVKQVGADLFHRFLYFARVCAFRFGSCL